MSRALRIPKRSSLAAASLAALLLSACGNDGDGDGGGGGGGGSAAFTRGAITAKTASTVTVNGVSIQTSGAAVQVDGQSAGAADLQPGMIVMVSGSFDDRSGSASEIRFEDSVKGKVDDKGTDFISVGGARVNVDDSTEFGEDNPARLGSVNVGDRVRVSGVADDKGGLRASRIDDSPGTSEDLELKGFVSDLTASGFTLKVSPTDAGFTVTLASGATLPAGIANGSYVEVRSAGPVTGNAIVAASVSLEDRHGGFDEVEFEGIVTSGNSAEFVVDGVTVRTSASTRWQFGVPADLIVGTKVEAEGTLDAAGVLDAHKVSFRAVIRIQAAVADLASTATGQSFTLLGIPVTINDLQTRIEDPVVNGGVVELRGMPDRSGTGVVGLRVRSRNDDRIELQGLVAAEDEAAGTVGILGITVQTGSGTSFRDSRDTSGSGVEGPSITRAQFFAAVEAGNTVVKARGENAAALSGGILTAEEAELEGDDD
jgi:hypothetical protein